MPLSKCNLIIYIPSGIVDILKVKLSLLQTKYSEETVSPVSSFSTSTTTLP